MSAALLSLTGLFISAYLYLYKMGRIGTLACGTGGCETVQQSPWSRVGGIDVSLIGVLGYTGLLVLSLTGLRAGLETRRWPTTMLAALAGLGVAFTAYLTYLELFVIQAICRWCLGSAAVIVALLIVSVLDLRRLARPGTSQ